MKVATLPWGVNMKRLISATTMTLAATLLIGSANAAQTISCGPMIAEMDAQSDIVANFSKELSKLESKLGRIENKLDDKRNQISQVASDIQNEKQLVSQKENDKVSLVSSIGSIEAEKSALVSENQSLSQLMNQLSMQIDNLPARSNARRVALRERKRSEKLIEANQAKIVFLNGQIQPVMSSISSLERSIMASLSKINVLKDKRNQIKNAQPTLEMLVSKKEQAQIQLLQSDSVQQANLSALEFATEKVEMCKTYTVKYPLALEIAKEIYAVGCDRYVPRNLNGAYKHKAQAETLESICGISAY